MSQLKWILAAALVLVTGQSRADEQSNHLTAKPARPKAIMAVEHEGKAYVFGLKKEVSTYVTDAGKQAAQALSKEGVNVEEAIADVQKSNDKANQEIETNKIKLQALILKGVKLGEGNAEATLLATMPIAKKATASQLADKAFDAVPAWGCRRWGFVNFYNPYFFPVTPVFFRPVVYTPAFYGGFWGGFYPGPWGIYNSFGFGGGFFNSWYGWGGASLYWGC